MDVYLYDDAGIQETQNVGNTRDGIPIPRVGECVYGMTSKMRGTVTKVSYHYDTKSVYVYVKRI